MGSDDVVDVLREAICLCADEQRQPWPAASWPVSLLLARLALLPLTLPRLARSAARQQEAMRRLKPELDAARRIQGRPCPTSQRDPAHFRARRAVDDSGRGVPGNYHADPVLLALYNAVRETTTLGGRFLWIRDISKPDMALAMVVAAITAASMAAGPQSDGPAQQRMVAALPAVFTLVALWQMASGVGLYWGVSSLVSVAQGLIVRHALVRRAARGRRSAAA